MSDNHKAEARNRLDSWKEIAAFFHRNERTVNRWEKERGLPVHRMPGGERGRVFAYEDELAAWLISAEQQDIQGTVAPQPAAKAPAESNSQQPPTITAELPRDPQSWIRRHRGELGTVVALIALGLLVVAYRESWRSVAARSAPAAAVTAASSARQQAEELYLEGRYHWNKRTGPDLTQALDDFTKSTQLDPTFAKGYAGSAACYNLLREYTDMPGSQAFPLAIAAAKKAIALDDSLAEGHRALAFAYFYWNWDAPGAEREFRRAIALDPNDAESHHWYATALTAMGRNDEALQEIERARKLDPTSSSIAADRALLLSNSDRIPEAISVLQELEAADPGFLSPHLYLAGIYFYQRRFDKWLDESAAAAALSHNQRSAAEISAFRVALQNEGPRAMLELRLRNQQEDFREGRSSAFLVADTLVALDRRQEALDYLEKAYQRHEYIMMSMGVWNNFRTLHGDPQFQDLLKRINFQPADSAAAPSSASF
ncbi:MAG: tetratricopeptide repeat protein [Candidatus Acidiferrales bacterium]